MRQHYLLSLCAVVMLATSGCFGSATPDLSQVESALATGRFQDARAMAVEIRKSHGASPETARLLAEALLKLGDGFSAEPYIDEWRLNADDPPEAGVMMGRALLLQKRPWRAIEWTDQQIEQHGLSADLALLKVQAMLADNSGVDVWDLAEEYLERFPNSAGLEAFCARFHIDDDDWEGAIEHIDNALALDPQHYEALLLSGERAIVAGELEQALVIYRRIAQDFPDYPLAKANVAGLLLDLEQVDEGENVVNQALGQHPNFEFLRYQKARIAFARGQHSAALEVLQALPQQWLISFSPGLLMFAEVEMNLAIISAS